MVTTVDFTTGKQPCTNLKRATEGKGTLLRPHLDACPVCRLLVTRCENCKKHHHAGGWPAGCLLAPTSRSADAGSSGGG